MPEKPPSGNLLILAPSLRVGGTERQITELIIGLQATSSRATLVLLQGEGDFLSTCRAAGVTPVVLGADRIWLYPSAIKRLHQLVREERPDTLYSLLSPANFIASVYGFGNRKLKIIWGIRGVDHSRRGFGRRVARLLTTVLKGRANGVIVNGHSVADALVAFGFNRETIRVVPNAIDTRRFRPDADMREACRNELGIAPDVPVVVCVARLVPGKGHDELLQAFVDVRKEHPTGILLLAGGGGEPEYVARLVERATTLAGASVRFLGKRGDVERLFNAADVSVLLSEAEGFPNAVAEALACGTPCVATRVGEIDRLIPSDDVIDVGDVAAAARAIGRHLSARVTPRRSLLADGYTPEQLVRNTMVALESL